MLGYYKVISGEISIANRNIDKYNIRWWRRQCGVVMQDGVIFSESIARNIAVDDGDIDIVRLEKAAKIANIHDYVMGLPLKYNTQIGRDGVGLSQGQKQRILIARAVYKDPDFISLDEVLTAVDWYRSDARMVPRWAVEWYHLGRTDSTAMIRADIEVPTPPAFFRPVVLSGLMILMAVRKAFCR